MRRSTRLLLTVLVLTLATLCTARPASAGGPTSVLLSLPGEGRVAALYHTDADYASLLELVGLTDPTSASSRSEQTHEGGQVVTLTWLIHDVQVWRVDRVHLGRSGRPWVETRQLVDERSVWEVAAVWHRAHRRLTALLDRVVPKGGTATFAGASAPAPLTPDPAPSGEEDSGSQRGTGVAWAAAGLLAGALLTAATTGLLGVHRRRRPAYPDDPRTATDRLAWP